MSTAASYFIIFVCVYLILTWAAYVPFKAGLLYNGTVYCMAIGGYFAAFMSKTFGTPFWICILGAIIFSGLFGFLPALGFSRTKGVVTAVSSMALIFIIQAVIRNIPALGAARGISGIKKCEHLVLFSLICVIAIGFILYRFEKSRFGRAFESIETDPDMAATLGVNVKRMTILGLTMSSVIAGVAGVIYAFQMRVVYPETFGFSMLLNIMTMMFVGGRYTQWGMLISVPILWGLNKWIPSGLAIYAQIIYGVILIIVLMAFPEGIVTRNLLRRIKNLFTGKKAVEAK